MTEAKKVRHQNEIILGKISPKKVHGMCIGKIASTFSFTFEETPIVQLADKLESENDIQAVGVISRKGKVKGLIIRKDLFGMLSKPFGRDVLRKKTADTICTDAQIFNVNDNIFTVSEAIENNVNSNTTFYLLTNDENDFCGIFSAKDMLVFLAEITKQDIALSRKIQTRIVKEQDYLTSKNFSICSSSVMAKGIGGDFYSFKKVSDSIHLFVLCDVSGKGMAASLLSSLLSGFINTYPVETDLKSMIEDLNAQLTRSFAGEKFITGLFMILNDETGQLEIADMGHSHYLVYSYGKPVKINQSKINIPLGVSSNIEVKTFTILLNKRDTIFMMTDGLIEQKNEEGGTYDYSRLDSILKNHTKTTVKVLRKKLLEDFDKFREKTPRQDDVTFIILKFNPDLSEKQKLRGNSNNSSLEEKIKWALSNGKPIQVKTNRYLPEDREFIDSVLDRFLNEAGIKFLMNKVSYCVHELATNAKKANTKRVYFKSKKLDIDNPEHYELGMKNFKSETIQNIKYYLDKQKEQGYFIVILFQLTRKSLRIAVMNNSEMTLSEKKKITHKLQIAGKASAIGEIYDQIEDYSEGAGLGIVMMSQMLRTMGFSHEALKIESVQGLTTSTITINLRE